MDVINIHSCYSSIILNVKAHFRCDYHLAKDLVEGYTIIVPRHWVIFRVISAVVVALMLMVVPTSFRIPSFCFKMFLARLH